MVEAVYLSTIHYTQQIRTTDLDERRTNVLNELYKTEEYYLNVLEIISQNFYSILVGHITSEDEELFFSVIKVIKVDYFSVILSIPYMHLNKATLPCTLCPPERIQEVC